VWLRNIGWIACVVYSTIPSFWLMIHPYADYWRSRGRSPYRILLPVWFAMWIVVGLLTSPWRRETLHTSPLFWTPAVLLFATGLWLYIKSSKGFSAKQLGGLPELHRNHPQQGLVKSGIRSHVRHPVYLAHLLEMVAWSMATGLAVCYVLTAFAAATGTIMIRMEDAELEHRFGPDYIEYKQEVPALIPRL